MPKKELLKKKVTKKLKKMFLKMLKMSKILLKCEFD